MTAAIQQRRAPLMQARGLPAVGRTAAHLGHHAMVAGMVRDFEQLAARLADLEEFPLDLFERFARALNGAERKAITRIQRLEEREL